MMTQSNQQEKLIKAAKKVQENAYAPYSNFSVGAALLTENGEIYTGCNVENISFGLTCCAERVAVFKMIAEKGKQEKIQAIAVSTKADIPCAPCGACRQVIHEFSHPNTMVIYKDRSGYKTIAMKDLLVDAFNEIR